MAMLLTTNGTFEKFAYFIYWIYTLLCLRFQVFPCEKQVNQKMILTLTASIMYWSLQRSGSDLELEAVLNEENKTPGTAPGLEGEGETALTAQDSNSVTDEGSEETSPRGENEGNEKEKLIPEDVKEETPDGE